MVTDTTFYSQAVVMGVTLIVSKALIICADPYVHHFYGSE